VIVMNKKYKFFLKLIILSISTIFCLFLGYWIIILMSQGIMLAFLLTILFTLCIMTNFFIITFKAPKQLKIASFQEELLTFIDIDGWECQAIRIHKEIYQKILKENVKPQELNDQIKNRLFGINNRIKDGIYLLIGRDHDKNKDLIYVGETSDFKRRMYEHKRNYNCDWVDYIYFFTNTKENFGPTIRKKTEIMLIQMIDNNNLILKNTKSDSKEIYGLLKKYSVLRIVKNIRFILKYFQINLYDPTFL